MITMKDGMHVEDGGGNLSDCSVEEMPEVYFKKSHHHRRFSGSGRSRVWSRDNMLRHYQPHVIARTSYTANLCNFAWAQAVQNKPLGFAEADADTSAEKVPGDDGLTVDEETKKEVEEDVGEKEEGELEEGEIDDVEFVGERTGDFSVILEGEKKADDGDEDLMTVSVSLPDDLIKKDKVVNDDGNNNNNSNNCNLVEDGGIDNGGEVVVKVENECEEEDTENLDTRVISVLEDLETISEGDAEKSFEGACSRLQKAMENLRKMVLEGHLHVLDAVIQQAFEGVQTIHSVFLRGQEQNKDAYCRFLAFIKRQKPLVLSSDQMKELDSMIQILGSEYVDKVAEGMSSLDQKLVISNSKSGGKGSTPFSRLPALEALVIPRVQTEFRPLLDPHVNHDEGSLPSPTRESATPLPLPSGTYSGDTAAFLQPTTYKQDAYNNDTILPYVTDAFKAVSSYQQKYNHISHISNNQLPSPTPSEENNEDNGDIHGEVSSSGVANARIEYSSSTSLNMVDSSVYPHPVGYTADPVDKTSAKSRDPRLRFPSPNTVSQTDFNRQSTPSRNEQLKNDPSLRFSTSSVAGPLDSLDFNKQSAPSNNEEMKNGVNFSIDLSSRKQKCMDGQTFNSHSLKRQRSESLFGRELEMPSSTGGWLEVEDNGAMEVENVNSSCSTEVVSQKKKDYIENNSCAKQDAVTSVRNNPTEAMNTIPDVSLTSLLKGIAANPTILMHLVKEQQRQVAEFQQKSMNSGLDATSSPSTNGPARVSFPTDTTIKDQDFEYKPVGSTQSSPQSAAMAQNESVRLRMKPRDPRRVLHNNIIWKTECSDPEPIRACGSSPLNTSQSNDCTTTKEQGQQTQSSGPPSQPTLPSDITCQFTKKLKSVTDMLPIKPEIASVIPQNVPQSVTRKSGGLNASQFPSSVANEMNLTSTSQSSSPWGDVGHLLNGYDEKQKAAFQRERTRRIEEQSKMFAARKLCLVLDLDHTLLNSAKFVEVDQFHDEILKKKEEQDREKPQRHLFRFQHMGMWTKLRPGIWNFLEKASKLFELHLYTMGNNLYATEMAKVLDPTGTLFAGRVISKGDDSDPFYGDDKVPKSKDLEGVLGMESAVVIIDDSVRVWPHHKLNLIVVERYTYFPSSRRQFGLLGPSLLEIDHDERPEEGTLASSLAVIERIHQNFFSHPSLENIDVRNILASEQRKILSGCRIVFSRIFPVGEVNPHLHPLWQTAEQFGAVCTNNIDDQVTHVVANSLGTDKVNWALSTGRFAVHPGWVEASALLYRRANEVDFTVKL